MEKITKNGRGFAPFGYCQTLNVVGMSRMVIFCRKIIKIFKENIRCRLSFENFFKKLLTSVERCGTIIGQKKKNVLRSHRAASARTV